MAVLKTINRRFCVAPMLDYTDRHQRYLARLMSKQAVLYTEMVSSNAVLQGDREQLLYHHPAELPLALQLGGSEVDAMVQCAEIGQSLGYSEININVGCPSNRVQSGSFGACLLLKPQIVAENVKQMQRATDIPITVKTRIGVDEQDPRTALWRLVELCAQAGCQVFIVHARKAWLNGLSPKQNRTVPPLDYALVYQLKQDFPELEIIINGGIKNMDDCRHHLQHVDGVMMGRQAYANPYLLAEVDASFYGSGSKKTSRKQIVQAYTEYINQQLAKGHSLRQLNRPISGLYYQQPGARSWRKHLNEVIHEQSNIMLQIPQVVV